MNTEEFKKLREKLGYTQEKFANLLGVHVRTIQNWESGGKIPKSKAALLRNIEFEIKTTIQDEGMSENGKKHNESVGSHHSGSKYSTYLLPVDAMAGNLSGWAESVSLRDCEKIVSPVPGAEFAIRITGDSMEPLYHDGMYVFIRKLTDSFIPWGNPFVLDTDNGVVIKRIFPIEDNPKYIIARSENPYYPSYEIPVNSIFGIYRILGGSFIVSTL